MTRPDDPPGFHRTYGVELLYERDPQLDTDAVVERLRQRVGRLDAHGSSALHLAFPEFTVRYSDGEIPAQMILGRSNSPLLPDVVEEALQQTWNWAGARAAVEGCTATWYLRDMMASGLEPRDRLSLFADALASVLEVAECRAIHWGPSGHFVDPAAFLEVRREGGMPLFGALNVRLFNIQDRGPGEMVMDTLGLAALGRPDLQCHFGGLEPGAVAGLLYNLGHYLFENGDVIDDGHTVQGLSPDQKWRCRHEDALLEPERMVIDIDPGLPYAAGNRY